jgi:hypothetical protein
MSCLAARLRCLVVFLFGGNPRIKTPLNPRQSRGARIRCLDPNARRGFLGAISVANRRETKACASRCLVGFLFGGSLRIKPPLHELPLLKESTQNVISQYKMPKFL